MLSQVRDLDLQLLRLFISVVENGGFSAAQGDLGIGQSTISTQMAKLETRLGFRVCERGKAGFRLTPKGEEVLLATRKLFTALDVFKNEARGMADKLLGDLCIGLSEALDPHVLAKVSEAIRLFRQRNQAVQIELRSAAPAELERRLLQDQMHLAIGYFSGVQAAIDHQLLFTEEQALYCGDAHPFFARKKLTLQELSTQDGVKYPYRFDQADDPWQAQVSSARSEQVEGTLAFVLSGAHLGYLPTHIAAPWVAAGRLRALLPKQLSFSVNFYLGSHRGRQPSEAQKAFAADLFSAFQQR